MDLDLFQFNACSLGAADRNKDLLAIEIQGAYYDAYWNNAKRPKSLQYVLNKIYKERNAPAPPVDVDLFQKRKRRLVENARHKGNKDSNL